MYTARIITFSAKAPKETCFQKKFLLFFGGIKGLALDTLCNLPFFSESARLEQMNFKPILLI